VRLVVVCFLCLSRICLGPDALDSWTTNSLSIPNSVVLQSLTFGNSRFLATGSVHDSSGNFIAGTITASPDGATWTQSDLVTTNAGLATIIFANNRFVAVGGQDLHGSRTGSIFTSEDGITWISRDPGTTNVVFYGVTYGNGRLIVVGGDTNAAIVSSADGMSWTSWHWTPNANALNPPFFNVVAFGNGRYVAMYGEQYNPSTGTSIAISTDGTTWTQNPYSVPGQGAGNLTFGNGVFVAVGGYQSGFPGHPTYQNHAVIWTSEDGLNWTQRADYTNSVDWPGFTFAAFGGGQFVTGGRIVDGRTSQLFPLIYTSSDGTNWVGRDVKVVLSSITFGNGQFVGVGGNTAMQSGVIGKLVANISPSIGVHGSLTGVTGQSFAIQTSPDLSAWTALTNVTISSNGLAGFSDLASTNSRFYRAVLR
jgi:hypothetical protein